LKLPFSIASRPIQGNFDALLSILGGNRIVRGVVAVAAGGPASVLEGTGFTVTWNATGTVTITFNPAFADRPSVIVTPVGGARAAVEATGSPASGSQYQVSVFTTNTGASVDAAFHFIAIGPG
jgi:hypothetical protein